MAVLEQVRQMKKQGLPNQEIINKLQEQNISPKEITDALEQSQIKDAIEGETKIMEEQTYEPNPNEMYSNEPTTTQPSPQNYSPGTEPIQNNYAGAQEYYPQEETEANYAGTTNTDTLIEISEQVFTEKIKKIEKEIDKFKEFSILTQTKLENVEGKLKRIESIIDNLQIKILEKISSYGNNLNSIKKEMTMMQDSFTKMIPEIAKKQTSKIKITKKKIPIKKISKKKK